MHIPDGYLCPQTCLPLWGVMAAYWTIAMRHVKRSVQMGQAPLLAMGAAFSFLIMMFNVPIPGGTTGHAVGSVLIAILLGPRAACVAVSMALAVQALLFGDGGILALGANCFTMGVIMPAVGWGVYRLMAAGRPSASPWHWIGAAAGGYVGLSAAAVAAGLLFGIQPLIACDAAGRPLYCPFGLSVALPAMAAEHLLVFGFVEALATGLVVAHAQRAAPALLGDSEGKAAQASRAAPAFAAALGGLILLSPLGLLLPDMAGAGAAWGEWSSEELAEELAKSGAPAHIPQGIAAAESASWAAPLPDYGFPWQADPGLAAHCLAYAVCAFLGAAAVVLLVLGMSRAMRMGAAAGQAASGA